MYPYLLKGLAIERPNQVWTADITYIPFQRGFLYLVAVMDWATRCVLSWRLSNTLDARFCTEALTDALERYGRPEIFNTDQGSQFTSLQFTDTLKDAGVAISMDGRGRCMDNIFIERLWRSLKYEAVYLHELSDGFQAQRVIARWMEFYNTQRPHSALSDSTPAEAYEKGMMLEVQAEAHRSPAALPAQPEQETVLNRTLAAGPTNRIHLNPAAILSKKPGPPQRPCGPAILPAPCSTRYMPARRRDVASSAFGHPKSFGARRQLTGSVRRGASRAARRRFWTR